MTRPLTRGFSATVLASLFAASAWGALAGTVAAVPAATVTPGLTSASAGTLLATHATPFVTSTGTASGTLSSAVYREAGGTLDFYYQVVDATTSTNCGGAAQPGCTSLVRLTGLNFVGYATALGYRSDGASLPASPFVDGTVVPVEADRDLAGTAVGFSFNPPVSARIQPGTTSSVMVISTNATNFTMSTATVVGGGGVSVAALGPASISASSVLGKASDAVVVAASEASDSSAGLSADSRRGRR